MSHTQKEKKALLNRVRRLRGQLDGLERSLDEGLGCYDILQQISAVRGAVNGLMGQVLEGHIREHMQPLAGDDEPEATDGLIKVLRSYLK
ncbi:metal/formaldehyde-sensitive transcriptional repressor [Pseudaeromonas pectinilytica]|jgi:DNA-binding FrmR family transcriptional regulator|nr:metal/formaldehyde-sensitive transcriptional repressor [Aeromonadaceae bacterium]MBP8773135.1 metal/formaldehyde-sensitive transcriptional repressor [Aeromonadaceae bacterium]